MTYNQDRRKFKRNKIELFKTQEVKVYIFLLLAISISTAVVDFMLLTNFKASVLIIFCTLLLIFANYNMSISAIGGTSEKFHANIFSDLKWFKYEWAFTFRSFLLAAAAIFAIFVFWYWPRSYSINWSGVIFALFMVPFASFSAGFIGTLRGLQKYKA